MGAPARLSRRGDVSPMPMVRPPAVPVQRVAAQPGRSHPPPWHGPCCCLAEGQRHGWAPCSARGQPGPGCWQWCPPWMPGSRSHTSAPRRDGVRVHFSQGIAPAQVSLAGSRKQPERRRVDSPLSNTQIVLSSGRKGGEAGGWGHIHFYC